MDNNKIDIAKDDAKAIISKDIDEFGNVLKNGTASADGFLTLSEIEEKWADLNKRTSKTYSDMVSAFLSNANEKDIIRSKKDSSGRKESG